MRCAKCGCDRSSVIDSRGEASAIRRRRECQDCGFRFTTYERVELSLPLIIKKDDRREPFDRAKLRAGILRACEKRPVSVEAVDETVAAIERRVHELCVKEMPSRQLGDFLMEELKTLDHIAYVRFASVYREFSDISQFVDTLQALTNQQASSQDQPKNTPKSVNG
ncbi:MAG: transcriptional repressor NrdR [Bdellovibrionales bacterium]|nr:transcriptional repressor NrdR [Bdellovibrionales bacterium]